MLTGDLVDGLQRQGHLDECFFCRVFQETYIPSEDLFFQVAQISHQMVHQSRWVVTATLCCMIFQPDSVS